MKPLIPFILGMAISGNLAPGANVGSSPVHTSASAAGSSFNPAFSADGHHLVFVSHAHNLTVDDFHGMALDVFARDLVNSNTILVSVSSIGFGGANADANYPSISSNGQFIAFASRASNLVPGDTNDAIDVFVRDVVNETTRLVSVDVNGNSPVDPAPASVVPLAGNPLISADGRWVFFESRATNLIAGGASLDSVNVYARDTWSNVTVLVSADATGMAGADGNSRLGSITPDARFAAFSSTATNFITGLTNTGVSIYLRDMPGGQIVWATTNCIGCDSPVIDASGRVIAYFSRGTDGMGNVVETDSASVLREDRLTGDRIPLGEATNLFNPIQMSANGSVIAYNQKATGGSIVYVWKPATGTNGVAGTTAAGLGSDGNFLAVVSGGQLNRINLTDSDSSELITTATNALQSTSSFAFSTVAVSPDGNFIAFDSTATDLVNGDLNGASDIFLRDMNAGVTELITKAVPSRPSATAFAHSFLGLNSLSADGRFVVSLRYDDPSAYRDTNGWPDVFVHDVVNGVSAAASISSNAYVTNFDGGADPVVTSVENTNAFEGPIISADGAIIFATRRTTAGQTRIYGSTRSNALAGAGMEPVSRGVSPTENGDAFGPSVSSNGLLLVFTSTSTDLVEGISDGNLTGDVFLRRITVLTNGLLGGSNELISVSMSGAAGNGMSSNGVISADGRWVIFESAARDLTTDNLGGMVGLYARDLSFNETHLASVGPNGNNQWGYVPGSAAVSGNSRFVAFASANIYLVVHDLITRTSVIAAEPVVRSPSLNFDGRFVAYVKRPTGANFDQIYVRDLQGAQTDLASANLAGAMGNGNSSAPLLSGDGRYVVFQSRASDLVAGDLNGANDIFVRDRLLGVTTIVSGNSLGQAGNGPSTRPVLAADGRTVAFQSFASDLVGGDYNDKRDVFILKLGGADTDGDGMDDDWEVAYFGDLSRDGSGDFDGDGVTDLQEFRAGTDPTNGNSVFRVLTVTPMGGGSTRVMWSGNPDRTYRVEYKDDLSLPDWTALSGATAWNGSTASLTDLGATASGHRYYRVVRLP